MASLNNRSNYVFEKKITETAQGVHFHEMLYKRMKPDITMTCSKHVFIPYAGNRNRRLRPRSVQTVTTVIQAGQDRFMEAVETTVPASAETALLLSLQNLTIRADIPKPRQGHGQPRNPRQQNAQNSRARQGAIPRNTEPTKIMRSSKITMVKNGPRTSISSVQSVAYQSGRDTTVRTGEAIVTRDMRMPPAYRTSVFTGSSQQTWTAPEGPQRRRYWRK